MRTFFLLGSRVKRRGGLRIQNGGHLYASLHVGFVPKSAAMVSFRIVCSILESMAYKAALSSLSVQKCKIICHHITAGYHSYKNDLYCEFLWKLYVGDNVY